MGMSLFLIGGLPPNSTSDTGADGFSVDFECTGAAVAAEDACGLPPAMIADEERTCLHGKKCLLLCVFYCVCLLLCVFVIVCVRMCVFDIVLYV